MLSANERVIPEPPCPEPPLPTVPLLPPSARKADSSMVQRIALPSDVTSGSLMEAEPSAADQTLLQHRTALQEELSAQLAQMAGQLRRNAEHFSNALAADQAVLHNAEEKTGANFDMMKQERVRLRDHHSRSLGTTCLTITSVLVVSIAFVIMLLIVRLTWAITTCS
ncbi:hypothetical protein BJV78DRAFT_1372312 [Lactifluus subvellereus]|nr:hypothetical protein BJV78DRAFT_1372312 [Lactifluus subvellereus]